MPITAHLPVPVLPTGLRRALLRYYAKHRRPLPWRQTGDPYAIWVSEIMLQQTQVDTVVPRYHAFLRQFASVQQLAAATERQICEAWAGLGYYRRARNLHRAAQVVVAEHGGVVPADLPALLALPGVGRYTAGAIASIAFGIPAPLVDGNVVRVLSRLFCIDASAESPAGKRLFWALAGALVVGPDPGALNQALMELGATLCTPRAPSCQACPVRRCCGAYAAGEVSRYPPAKVRAPRQVLPMALAFCAQKNGIWLAQRPLAGLWAGLWELPSAVGADAAASLSAHWRLRLGTPLAQITHLLTHRRVEATVYAARPAARGPHLGSWQLVAEPLSAPLSILARRALVAAQAATRG